MHWIPFRSRSLISVLLSCLLLPACSALGADVPDVALLPTLTPSPYASPTPAMGILPTSTPSTPTNTPTITLTPASSSTPLFALIPTLSDAQLTAGPSETANALPKPTVIFFKSFPSETETVAPGDNVTLFWSTTGATAAAVTRMNRDGTRGRSWAVNLPDGYLQITVDGVERTEQYSLTVTNGIATVEKTLSVTVACQLVWFFTPAPVSACPEANPSVLQANVQDFERGRMFWLSSTNEVIVLFNDAQANGNDNRPAWVRVTNPWIPGMPENDPALQPPPGLDQPQQGFGMVWRTMPGVSDRIGWAVGGENSFTMTTQRGAGEKGDFYLTDPSGAVIGLLNGAKGWLNVSAVTVPGLPSP
jgi:hypothetical protein